VGVRAAGLAVVAAAAVAAGCGGAAEHASPLLPRSFSQVSAGPDGGTMWAGVIPHPDVPDALRRSVVYLPPHASRARRLPVVYLLHGFRGSPFGYVDGLRFAEIADPLITRHDVPPFIAVIPAAGRDVRYDGEWAGRWERFVVGEVVPWADRTLPTIPDAAHRAIGGDSAGGYGAVDIGLRHRALFRTLESWSGYFRPIPDGPLAHASRATLRAHSPEALVAADAPAVRRAGIRIFVSAGRRDRVATRDARTFSRRLTAARIEHRLVVRAGGHNGRFWRAQLPDALRYALAPERSPLNARPRGG
jgi:enterochelin esterase-like enzyme